MTEEYRDIKGYEGLYQVSNFGNIKSLNYLRKKINKIRKLTFDKNKYLNISLSKNGNVKTFKVHRLVALTFIPNTENKNEINHINGIKDDNRIWNLEWVTSSENKIHSINVLLKKPTYGNLGKKGILSKLSKKVYQYNLENKFIKEWFSVSEAKKILNISKIADCARGEIKTAGGYKWSYNLITSNNN